MSFPQVAGSTTGIQATNSNSHAIALPAGVVAGDLLVCIFSVDGNPSITDGGAGAWTKLGQRSHSTVVTGSIWWRIATGSDALTLTTAQTEQSTHVTLRITGAAGIEGTAINGDTQDSDPPAHAAAGGAKDYLWLATRHGDAAVQATADPSGYGNRLVSTGGSTGASTAVARREANAASDDPGIWTSAAEQWVAYTLAVAPAAAGGTAYALTAEVGVLAVSGQAATLKVGHRMPADAGAFAAAGQVATFRLNRVAAALPGAFAAEGRDAGLQIGRRLVADAGAVAMEGGEVAFVTSRSFTITAEPGDFALAGQPVEFDAPYRQRPTLAVLRPANLQGAPRPGRLQTGRRPAALSTARRQWAS